FRRRPVCKLLGLAAERILERDIPFGNKERTTIKSSEVVQLEQAIFGFVLEFQFAAAANMQGHNSTFDHRGTNHEETVALQGVLLRTHQSDVCRATQLQRPVNPRTKI